MLALLSPAKKLDLDSAFDAEATLDDNVERMRAESAALRSFTVITAAKDSVVGGAEGSRWWGISVGIAMLVVAVVAAILVPIRNSMSVDKPGRLQQILEQ